VKDSPRPINSVSVWHRWTHKVPINLKVPREREQEDKIVFLSLGAFCNGEEMNLQKRM
jgi:hypothetical protein